jgi:glucokinase
MAIYLGLDFGGTKLAVGFADASGTLLGLRRCPTDAESGPTGALAAMQALFAELVATLGPEARRPAAVGISFGGPVDPSRRRTLLSHHGPGWEDYPLVERVAALWPGPVAMDNDANAAALGEGRFGAGRGYPNLLYVTVSTGIGGGVLVDGQLYRGSRGLAGEIGHTIVVPEGPRCACGKRGCLEALAAGPAIARAYAERQGLPEGGVSAADVFDRAAAGEPLAQAVVAAAIHWLGLGLANAINLLDPDLVVIGGGVSRAGAALFQPLRAEVRAVCAPSPPDTVPIVPAALADAVGVLGAIALVEGAGGDGEHR